MRLIGNEVIYYRTIADNQILEQLSKNNSIILFTKDEELSHRCQKGEYKYYRIIAENHLDQFREVLEQFKGYIKIKPFNPFCPHCSGTLEPISKLQEKIPSFINHIYQDYWQCQNSSCNQLFWRGIKWRDFILTITQIIELKNCIELYEKILKEGNIPHRWVIWSLHGLANRFFIETDFNRARDTYNIAIALCRQLPKHERTQVDDEDEINKLKEKLKIINRLLDLKSS